MSGDLFSIFTASFVTFFVLIDAVGVAPIFASLTARGNAAYRRSMAIRSVLVATLMELAGAALFVADFALGAKLLMLFILLVTPIMHPFWAAYPDAHTERAVDMIMFFKNASLFGALLVYLEMKPTLEAMRPKLKTR